MIMGAVGRPSARHGGDATVGPATSRSWCSGSRRGHRRLQGGRGLPGAGRRRNPRGTGADRAGHPVRREGHLRRPGLGARPDQPVGRGLAHPPHPARAAGRSDRGGTGHRRPAGPVRRRASPTICSPRPWWPRPPRWWCARPCTPRCGSTRPSKHNLAVLRARGVTVVAARGRAAGRRGHRIRPAGRAVGDRRRRARCLGMTGDAR